MLKKIGPQRFGHILEYTIFSALVLSGFLFTTGLVRSNLNSQFIQISSFINQELFRSSGNQQEDNEPITIVGSHRTRALTWIPKYIFGSNVFFRDTDIPGENFTKPIPTERFILVADSILSPRLNDENHLLGSSGDRRVAMLYHNASETIATYLDTEKVRYDFMTILQNYGLGQFVEIKANY
jgi:hypothetical protein